MWDPWRETEGRRGDGPRGGSRAEDTRRSPESRVFSRTREKQPAEREERELKTQAGLNVGSRQGAGGVMLTEEREAEQAERASAPQRGWWGAGGAGAEGFGGRRRPVNASSL